MSVFVSNLQAEMALDSELTGLVSAALQHILHKAGYGAEAEVSLVFVDDNYIQEMNRRFRRIDRPTDVLSFAMLEGESLQEAVGAEVLLGDIVISLPTASRQAAEYGHSFHREVVYLTIHGMLHLLGYDHLNEEDRLIMRQKEKEIIKELNSTHCLSK